MWLLEERTQGMCSIRGNRTHLLNQLLANPVAQSHILIFIIARVRIHTSTSHGVFPPIPSQSVSDMSSCFIHLFARPKFANPQLHDDGLWKHEHFLNLLCLLLPSGTLSSYSPPFYHNGIDRKKSFKVCIYRPWTIYMALLMFGRILQPWSLLKSAQVLDKAKNAMLTSKHVFLLFLTFDMTTELWLSQRLPIYSLPMLLCAVWNLYYSHLQLQYIFAGDYMVRVVRRWWHRTIMKTIFLSLSLRLHKLLFHLSGWRRNTPLTLLAQKITSRSR